MGRIDNKQTNRQGQRNEGKQKRQRQREWQRKHRRHTRECNMPKKNRGGISKKLPVKERIPPLK